MHYDPLFRLCFLRPRLFSSLGNVFCFLNKTPIESTQPFDYSNFPLQACIDSLTVETTIDAIGSLSSRIIDVPIHSQTQRLPTEKELYYLLDRVGALINFTYY